MEPNQQYQGFASDGLYFSWSFDDTVSDLLEEKMTVELNNNTHQPWDYHEGMFCLPDTREEIELSADDLLQFSLNEYLGEGAFSLGLNIHGDYYGPEKEILGEFSYKLNVLVDK